MVERASASDQTKLFLSANPTLNYPRVQTRRLGGVLNLISTQADIATNSRENLITCNASNIPSTFVQGASTIQIQIPPTNVFLKHLRVEFTLSNTGANPVDLLPVPLWFASVNVAGNSGNTMIQQWNSPAAMLLSQVCNIPDEQLIAIAKAINIDPTNPSNKGLSATLAAGATNKFYMDFPDAFWENVSLWMGDLKGNLVLTLNSSANGAIDVTSGGGTIATVSLTNCRALMTVVQPSPEQAAYQNQQTVRDNQFLSATVTSVQKTLAPSVQYNILMSANLGLAPWVFIITRGLLPFATPAAARNWPDVTHSISLLDSSGNPIVQIVDEFFLSTFMAADYWQGSQIFSQMGGVMQWSFSSAPGYTQKSGAITGGYRFTSNEQYQFTTESTTTPGTYEISIITPVYTMLRIQNGEFSLYTS
jgi:hypothetical protein